jgi:RecA-family ATPase
MFKDLDKVHDEIEAKERATAEENSRPNQSESSTIHTDVNEAVKPKSGSIVVIDDDLPEDTDLCDFLETEIEEPKHLLQNFLRVGQVAIISGAAKTNKSWTMMEMALAVSQGQGKFFKWEANIGKVYYVDTELEPFDFQRRMKSMWRMRWLARS